MSTKTIDARGLSCPQPALMAYKAVEAGDFPIEITVDNPTPRENIRRMAEGKGCKVAIAEKDGDFVLTITR